MIEMFNNIGVWISNNIQSIVAFLTTGTLGTSITAIVLTILKGRSVKENTAASKELKHCVENTNELHDTLSGVSDTSGAIKENTDLIVQENNELKKCVEELKAEVNTVLDVMNLAYSTIKDSDIRSAITKTIASSKFVLAEKEEQLKAEVDELKLQLAANKENFEKALNDKIEELTKLAEEKKEVIQKVVRRG